MKCDHISNLRCQRHETYYNHDIILSSVFFEDKLFVNILDKKENYESLKIFYIKMRNNKFIGFEN